MGGWASGLSSLHFWMPQLAGKVFMRNLMLQNAGRGLTSNFVQAALPCLTGRRNSFSGHSETKRF